MTKDDKAYLPADTESLIPFLRRLYNAQELVALNLRGDHAEATKLAAKIEFIDELEDLWQEQKEEAAKARDVLKA